MACLMAVHCRLHPSEPSRARKTGTCNELFKCIRGFDIVFVADAKQSSVDQRMRLGMLVCFRQERTCRRTRPGQLCASSGLYALQHVPSFDHLVGAAMSIDRHIVLIGFAYRHARKGEGEARLTRWSQSPWISQAVLCGISIAV